MAPASAVASTISLAITDIRSNFKKDPPGGQVLKHLGLWDRKARPPPKATRPPKLVEHHIDYSHRGVGPYGPEAISQLPALVRRYCGGPARRPSGGSDKCLYVDPEYQEVYPP